MKTTNAVVHNSYPSLIQVCRVASPQVKCWKWLFFSFRFFFPPISQGIVIFLGDAVQDENATDSCNPHTPPQPILSVWLSTASQAIVLRRVVQADMNDDGRPIGKVEAFPLSEPVPGAMAYDPAQT